MMVRCNFYDIAKSVQQMANEKDEEKQEKIVFQLRTQIQGCAINNWNESVI